MSIETIQSDFEFLDDWEDRYRYVIELGRGLEPLRPEERTEAAKVRGCASQVWFVIDPPVEGTPQFRFRGESDAHIVQGLIAILREIYNDRSPSEVLATDAEKILAGLGLSDHLTQQRSNGLKSMIERIRQEAKRMVTA